MATWTNIPDSVLEPGKPVRSVDALALRDNAIAIAEGAAGAPKVQTPAIQNGAITPAKYQNSVASSNVPCLYPLGTAGETSVTSSTGPVDIRVPVFVNGAVRLSMGTRKSGISSGTARFRIYRSGTLLQTWTHTSQSPSFTQRRLDFNISAGDQIRILADLVGDNIGGHFNNLFLSNQGVPIR